MRNQNWRWDTTQPFSTNHADIPAKAALYLFDGDVYTGLAAQQMLDWAASPLCQWAIRNIVWVVRLVKTAWFDATLPPRNGHKTKNPKGENLYQFWGDTIADLINQRMADNEQTTLINLASNEYFKSVNPKKITADIITPRFEDGKDGQYKVVKLYAKKARG